MRTVALAALLSLLPLTAFAADTCSLTVKVEDVSTKGGNLRIGVYDEATFVVRGAKPMEGKSIPAKPGEMIVTFDGLKPGEYGVKVFQDENANGKMDFVMGMMPSEPYGMSNDARPSMSGPPWDEAKFTLKPGANATTVHLH
ncbi:MAG: DUF2141 domain-containing protein [Proteobacteria bacterium]|nr:DUF2141 domain-containing protein [Pseudomonadota bacterium]